MEVYGEIIPAAMGNASSEAGNKITTVRTVICLIFMTGKEKLRATCQSQKSQFGQKTQQ
jgi:hypothetical protein